MLPIHSVEGSGPELKVAGNKRVAIHNNDTTTEFTGTEIKYTPEEGVLVGDVTWHGTRECDHRPKHDFRLALNIFLVDFTEIANNLIDIFPVPGDSDWLWAQRARHWRKETCMLPDTGRAPFQADGLEFDRDKRECHLHSIRTACPRSCNVYMDDEEF